MKKYKVIKTFTYDGKRYYIRANTKAEAAAKEAIKKQALERNKLINPSKRTVSSWAKECINVYKVMLSGYPLGHYIRCMRLYVLDSIGSMKLKDVRPIACQKVINNQAEKSQYVINQTYQMMNFIFSKAVDNKLIYENPAKSITKPKGYKIQRRSLTPHEEAILLQVIPKHQYGLYFALIYFTGCRPGEASKVQGRDIVYKDDLLCLHIRGTKSSAADRYVPLPNELKEMLPVKLEPFKLICPSQSGRELTTQNKKHAWASLTRLMNIEMGCRIYSNQLLPPYPLSDDLTTYCLRHTFCTNLAKKSVDIRTAQYMMGHSSISMTANIYTHTDIESLKIAANQINMSKSTPQSTPNTVPNRA
ncbi:MAG TPA: site-specific integrase [Anaerovoracaceae bacterium]|nr:site-specific integrase [Anaerovoracaceae bacterium]